MQLEHYYAQQLLVLILLSSLSSSLHSVSSFCMIPSTLFRRNTPLLQMTSSAIEQVAKRLVSSNTSNNSKTFVCIAVAGGGSHAISTLASTPGASALFLEGTVTYDRKSLQAYIGQTLSGDFVSKETAKFMSRAAVRHALQYRANVDDYPYCMGVGITSALVSNDNKQRTNGSFGYICATRADGTEWNCKVVLEPNVRTRAQEDVVMGTLALQAIEQLQHKGDEALVFDFRNPNDTIDESYQPVTRKDEVKAAAERILSGDAKSVLLLPNSTSHTFIAVTDPVLPMESLVFPGSFNPPHYGHTTLAQVASRAWTKSRRAAAAVFLELSLTNPDKPSINPEDVSARAHKFFELENLPDQWGILLTSAPLFKEKVEGLRPFMAGGMLHCCIVVLLNACASIMHYSILENGMPNNCSFSTDLLCC
jgi:nicotinamide mononucleotide (NMN) deamidase PncC